MCLDYQPSLVINDELKKAVPQREEKPAQSHQ